MSTNMPATTNQQAQPAVVLEIQRMMPKFASVLPPHVPAERFVRICLSALTQNPKLLECNVNTLLQSAMTAAQLGLEPDANLGQAYFVPFKHGPSGQMHVQLIVGYKGYLQLARNSGQIVSFSAHEVCENDFFEYKFGLNEQLDHIPAKGERGEVQFFYCVVKFKDGSHYFDVMSKAEVDGVKKRSKMGDKGPWVSDYIPMGKKTIIRRTAKYMPLSVYKDDKNTIQKAAIIEDNAMAGNYGFITESGDLLIDTSTGEVIGQLEQHPAESSRLDNLATQMEADKEEAR